MEDLNPDPFNERPVDPEWARRFDAVLEYAARELGCMVHLVAVQPKGRVASGVQGVPRDNPDMVKLADDPAKMLASLAAIIKAQQLVAQAQAKSETQH